MVYKIVLNEGFRNHVEEQRSLYGDFGQDVYLWDCITNLRFDSVEETRDFIHYKVAIAEQHLIEIKGEDCL